MGGFADLEVRIERDEVSFRIDGRDYSGPHGLSSRASIDALWDAGPAAYGTALFRATFGDGLPEEGYRAAVAASDADATHWRVRLNLCDPALHDIWWEALRDERLPHRKFATDRFTPLSRYLPLPAARAPVRAAPLRVLVAISSPADLGSRWPGLDPLDEELERHTLERAFAGLDVDWEVLTEPASLAALRRRLRDEEFHVLHVVGHGWRTPDGRGALLLEDDDQSGDPVAEERLGELVSGLGDSPLRLVVLASCHGASRSRTDPFMGLAPRLVEYGMPAVVAMQDRVSTDSARRFSQLFYDSLADPARANGMVDVAMNDARDELYYAREDGWDWAIPVLFLRGEGRVFELPAPAPAAPAAAGPLLSPVVGATAPPAVGSALGAVDAGLRMRLFGDLAALPVERLRTIAYFVLGEQPPELEDALAEVRARELLRRCEAGGRLGDLEHVLRSLPAAAGGAAR
ncbi:MAG TPA: CHAT domain-containing protein [Thermoleophilaceae bacterium]